MINLYGGQIADLLQSASKYNPEITALSYAIQMEKQRLLNLADQTRTLAMIDDLPEKILDVLAVELRTPYYSESMAIEQKREVIKGTLVWFIRAGTPAAIRELIAAIFGEGEVVEWFDFTEAPYTPGTFDIVTNARMTEDIVNDFLRIIGQVKNTRSHLRRVLINRECTIQERTASGLISAPKVKVLNGGLELSSDTQGREIAKAGSIAAPREAIINTIPTRGRNTNGPITGKAGAISAPSEHILNHAATRGRGASGSIYIGLAVAVEGIHLAILNSPSFSDTKIGQTQGTYSAAAASSIKISI